MSEPTRFGGHGARGRTLFVIPWVAMSLPHVLALMDVGPIPTAVGAAVALAAGLGLARVVYRTDEGVGCLVAVLAGGGMWLGWKAGEAWAGAPMGAHLGALGGAALLPALVILARAVVVRIQERADGG